MAIKGTVAILATATSLAMMNTSCEDNKQDISKKELIEVLDTKSESWTWENDNVATLLSSPTSEKNNKKVKENKESFNEDCFSVSLQDLEGTPFLWSKRMIALVIEIFLGTHKPKILWRLITDYIPLILMQVIGLIKKTRSAFLLFILS